MNFSRCEPQLDDLLDDPIIRAVMHRDAVAETALRAILDGARARLRSNSDDIGPAATVYRSRLGGFSPIGGVCAECPV